MPLGIVSFLALHMLETLYTQFESGPALLKEQFIFKKERLLNLNCRGLENELCIKNCKIWIDHPLVKIGDDPIFN